MSALEQEETADWRDDPAWRIVQWDADFFSEKPPDRPSADAELAQPPAWASLYAGRKIVATWARA